MHPPAFCTLSAADFGIDLLRARFYGHAYDRHFHDDYAIGLTDHGNQAFNARGARHVSTPGTVIAFAPGDVHDGEAGDAAGFAYRMLYVPERLVRDLLTDATERPVEAPRFKQPLSRDAGLARAVDDAARVLARPDDPLARHHAVARLAMAMGRVGGDAQPPPPDRREPRAVARTRAMLHDRMADGVTTAELAAATGLGPFALIRAFTREYGLPPHAYLLSVRLNAAQRQLAAGDMPADVAAACGFTDQAHLTREFRRRLGVTPGAYRKTALRR